MDIGIVGYGGYVPRFRISVEEIARIWGEDVVSIRGGLLVEEKSVADVDEDTITISVEAARNALSMAGIRSQDVGALYVGSESHPYAVKPSGTVVAEALRIGPNVMIADYEFACKAGTAAMQNCFALVKAGLIKYGMAIGADTAQGRPGDALEYTAAAGGAAFLIGKNPLAVLEGTHSYTSDTSDFWRREGQDYPSHGARFTGKPAYFNHVVSASKAMMEKMGMKPSDFKHAVFHTPNGKFPLTAGKTLGFSREQIECNLLVSKVGNTYSGASPLILCSVLDNAKPGERILMTSYGSGAGSDSFVFTVTDLIEDRRKNGGLKVQDYVKNKKNIDYGMYARLRGKLKA